MMDAAQHSWVLTGAISTASALIALALACSLARLILGPSLPDRVVSADLITILAVSIVGLLSLATERGDFLDVAIAVSLVAFLATIAFAWYADRQTKQRNQQTSNEDVL